MRRLLAVVLGLGAPLVSALSAAPPVAATSLEIATLDIAGPHAGSHQRMATSAAGLDVARRTTVAPVAQHVARAAHEVVVARGDTLWDIARRHLPLGADAAAVAHAWPRWWATNRDRIGPDPSLLLVGTRLRVPDLDRTTARRTGTSASPHHRPSPPAAPSRSCAQSLDPDRR